MYYKYMKTGGIYQHEDNTDVAILVLLVRNNKSDVIALRVAWINIVNNPFPIGFTEMIEIKKMTFVNGMN
jgi:hypothetical protein